MLPFLNRMMLGSAGGLNIDQHFSTSLYQDGDSANQVVPLAFSPDLVWHKNRLAGSIHSLIDTVRGGTLELDTQSTNAQSSRTSGTGNPLTDGFNKPAISSNGNTVTWAFKRTPKFFDIISYTGTGVSGREIPHTLSVDPGFVIIKRTNSSASTVGQWNVRHSFATGDLVLNTTAAQGSSFSFCPTVSKNSFTVITSVNVSGGTYVAYLFAHDPDPSGIIRCGQYTGNGSTTGPVVTLGWEPQWVLIKRVNTTGNWSIYDNKRSTANTRSLTLYPNLSNAETTITGFDFLSTGFQPRGTATDINANGSTYIYMAIRKGFL